MNNDRENYDKIINAIIYLKSQKKKLRKANLNDFINNNHSFKQNNVNKEKITSFRMQEEFGPKKRIKP